MSRFVRIIFAFGRDWLVPMRVIAAVATFVSVAMTAIVVEARECVRPGQNALITWQTGSAATARLYFRADQAKGEHYIDMRRSKERLWAVLPKPTAVTQSIRYRVATADAMGRYATQVERTVVVSDDCHAGEFTATQARASASLVVAMTKNADPTVPIGFACDGIIATISTTGLMSARNACADARVDLLARPGNEVEGSRAATTKKPSLVPASTGLGVVVNATPPFRKAFQSVPPPNPRRARPVSAARP